MYKKSQMWSLDLIAGITLFLIVVALYFIFVANFSESEELDQLYSNAIFVSDTLMSAGLPENWTASVVEEVGITNGEYRLNSSKITNLSSLDYANLKLLLKTRYDYLIFFENRSGSVLSISGIKYIGNPALNKTNIKEIENPDNLVSIKRFLFYKERIITMVLYLWQ
ncbi:hypothetical protein GF323_01875 [Candidatus Woesearchaeota archaeon]|nr:hypothetical protein [Candidatus Woesearchaeota archaeon]